MMLTVRFLTTTAILATAASAAEIPKGAHALLKMVNSVSSRTAKPGDQVYLQTAVPISANDEILVPAGSYVQGVVTHTKRSGRVAGRAQLAIRIETLTFPGGKTIRLSPHVSSVDSGGSDQKVDGENTIRQGSDHMKDLGRVAVLAGSGAAIGTFADRTYEETASLRGAGIGAGAGAAIGFATVLMTRGREVDLHAGLTLDVVFDRAVEIK